MTIASEITRLQGAKADICTAIENKGVTVGNITIDNYSCCIDAIPTGNNIRLAHIFLVGGGGGGGTAGNNVYPGGGGGGAGGLMMLNNAIISSDSTCVIVGAGGNSDNAGGQSCFGNYSVIGGGKGGRGGDGGDGGSGGGGGYITYNCWTGLGGRNIGGNLGVTYGHTGGLASKFQGCYCCAGGGGGGANTAGCPNLTQGAGTSKLASYGGMGININPYGTNILVAGGGGGGGELYAGCGCSGGGNGGIKNTGCNATSYGSGGGGGGWNGCKKGGSGCQGIVFVRYRTDGSCGFTSATGGNICRTCTIGGVEYKIHEFTSNGTFCITG